MNARSRNGWAIPALEALRFHGTALADKDNTSNDNTSGDNGDEDNTDNTSNNGNSDADNSDNSSEDNADNNSDNSDGEDNTDNNESDNSSNKDNADNGTSDEAMDNVSPTTPPPPAATSTGATPTGSETQASGTSNGGDSTIALSGDRVVVQVFPWMPAGITLTLSLIDPSTPPPPPGTRAGDLIFRIEAKNASGAPLVTLPAEVHLGVRYGDQDVAGLNKQNATLSWLDPADNRWKPAAKLATDPSTNYVAASVTALGTYAVSVP